MRMHSLQDNTGRKTMAAKSHQCDAEQVQQAPCCRGTSLALGSNAAQRSLY